jgi:hypothetical protein
MRRFGVCVIFLCLCGGCCLNHAEGEIVIGDPIEQPVEQRLTAEIDNWLSLQEFEHLMVYGADPGFWRWFAGAEIARFASGRLGLTAASPVMLWSAVLRTVDDGRTALWDFVRWLNS